MWVIPLTALGAFCSGIAIAQFVSRMPRWPTALFVLAQSVFLSGVAFDGMKALRYGTAPMLFGALTMQLLSGEEVSTERCIRLSMLLVCSLLVAGAMPELNMDEEEPFKDTVAKLVTNEPVATITAVIVLGLFTAVMILERTLPRRLTISFLAVLIAGFLTSFPAILVRRYGALCHQHQVDASDLVLLIAILFVVLLMQAHFLMIAVRLVRLRVGFVCLSFVAMASWSPVVMVSAFTDTVLWGSLVQFFVGSLGLGLCVVSELYSTNSKLDLSESAIDVSGDVVGMQIIM